MQHSVMYVIQYTDTALAYSSSDLHLNNTLLTPRGKFPLPYIDTATTPPRPAHNLAPAMVRVGASFWPFVVWWGNSSILPRQHITFPLGSSSIFKHLGICYVRGLHMQTDPVSFIGWRSGSVGRASDSGSKESKLEPREETGGLRTHEQTQHALVGLGSTALAAAVALLR